MTTGEDPNRRGSVDGGRLGGSEAGAGTSAPRRLPTFPFRGVNETGEIPVQTQIRVEPEDDVDAARSDTDEIPIVSGAAPGATPTAPTDADHPFGEDDDVDAAVEDEVEDEVDAHDREGVEQQPPSARLIVTIAIMTVLLIAASALVAYLWKVSDAWEARVNDLTDVSYGLGSDLADEQAALASANQSIDLLNDQLAASKDTVSRLQAENAQWGDDAAYAQEQIAALRSIIADATAVANSLNRCIEGHEQLVTYLESPDDYNPDELASFETSVTDLCTAAKDANLALQQEVTP